jgi:HAD superfamily hydrolase (TIGR01509 family)
MIDAVVFDLDGLLIESEQLWDDARRQFVMERGGRWHERAQREMMGMSSSEWSRYVHDELGVDLAPQRISDEVVQRLEVLYRERFPLLPGAGDAVERLAARWPLGLASSSNRELIDLVLALGGLAAYFRVTVSSEEVDRGKPAPDVYLEAAHRLSVAPSLCVAIEDSRNGIVSAIAARMQVVAIPNRSFPPGEDALGKADLVLRNLDDLTVEAIERRLGRAGR